MYSFTMANFVLMYSFTMADFVLYMYSFYFLRFLTYAICSNSAVRIRIAIVVYFRWCVQKLFQGCVLDRL